VSEDSPDKMEYSRRSRARACLRASKRGNFVGNQRFLKRYVGRKTKGDIAQRPYHNGNLAMFIAEINKQFGIHQSSFPAFKIIKRFPLLGGVSRKQRPELSTHAYQTTFHPSQ
jgi:hypothetical protein